MQKPRLVPIIAGALLLSIAGTVHAQVLAEPLWQTDGTVRAMLRDGDILYVGGDFAAVGPYTGGSAVVDAAGGQPLPGFPAANGTVRALTPDGSGGWYVGGNFTKIGPASRQGLAQVDANFAVTAWNPIVNGEVHTLALSGSTLYVGGSFTVLGGLTRSNIAAVSTVTGVPTPWNPGTNGTVRVVDVHTHQVSCPTGFCAVTQVYVGGDFTSAGGQARNRIAAIDPSTGLATTWNPNADGSVWEIDAVGSTQLRVYVGGLFTNIGGQPRNRIASLNVSAAATTWNPNANGAVAAISVQGSTIYVGGSFTQIGGQNRLRLAAIDGAGAATGWNPSVAGDVSTIAVDAATVYAGGSFSSVGGIGRRNAAAVDASFGLLKAWNPSTDGVVNTIAFDAASVCLGGAFSSVGQVPRSRIAAIDLSTGTATSWAPQADGRVSALATDGVSVFVGGDFTTIGGQPRSRIAAVDPITGLANGWDPSASGSVEDILVENGLIYAAGAFTMIGGAARNAVAALDPATGAATAWNAQVFPIGLPVRDLAVHAGLLYLGGDFSGVGAQGRAFLAAVDLASALPTAWNPVTNGAVRVLELDGSTLFVGGDFTFAGGVTRSRIAAFDLGSGAVTPWDPSADAPVHAIAVNGAKIYAGGLFSAMNGNGNMNFFAEIDRFTGAVSTLDAIGNIWFGAGGAVEALLPAQTQIVAGGSFTSMGSLPRRGLAAIDVQHEPLCGDIVPSASWPVCGTTVGLTRPSSAWSAAAAPDGSNGAYVAWLDPTTFNARLSRVEPDGTIAVGWPADGLLVSDDQVFGVPMLAEDGDGGVFVVWYGYRSDTWRTFAQRFDASGAIATGWPANGLAVAGLPSSEFSVYRPSAAVNDGFGGLLLAASDRMQRIDADGQVNGFWPFDGVVVPSVVRLQADGTGGAYYLGAGSVLGRVGANGSPQWQTTVAALPSFSLGYADIVADDSGGVFLIAGAGLATTVQRYSASGSAAPGWPVLGVEVAPNGYLQDAVLDGEGGLFVLWATANVGDDMRIHRVTAQGVESPAWPDGGMPIGIPGQEKSAGALAADGAGGVFVAWLGHHGPSDASAYATRLCRLGVPVRDWSTQGHVICPNVGFVQFSDEGVFDRGLVADGAAGAIMPQVRDAGSPDGSGFVQVLRLGSQPPSVATASIAVGSGVQVSIGGVTLTFDTVTVAGDLSVARTNGPAVPAGTQTVPNRAPAVYEISTTASYTGPIEVCLGYDPADVGGSPSALRLLHYTSDGGSPAWIDVTTTVDDTGGFICGVTTHLSPFAIVEATATSVEVPAAVLRLDQNHPNPFNPRTTIRFELASRGPVELSIFDARGRRVRTLVDGMQDAGPHAVVWAGEDGGGRSVASGVYFYRLRTQERDVMRRMVLVR